MSAGKFVRNDDGTVTMLERPTVIDTHLITLHPELRAQLMPWWRFPCQDLDRSVYLIAPYAPWRAALWARICRELWYGPAVDLGLLWLDNGAFFADGTWFAGWPWRSPVSIWSGRRSWACSRWLGWLNTAWRWHIRTRGTA